MTNPFIVPIDFCNEGRRCSNNDRDIFDGLNVKVISSIELTNGSVPKFRLRSTWPPAARLSIPIRSTIWCIKVSVGSPGEEVLIITHSPVVRRLPKGKLEISSWKELPLMD